MIMTGCTLQEYGAWRTASNLKKHVDGQRFAGDDRHKDRKINKQYGSIH